MTAEFPAAFHAHTLHIDFHPFGFRLGEKIGLITGVLLGAAFHSQTAPLVHHSQPRDNALPGASIGSVALDQCPIGVTFAILASIATSQIHNVMLRIEDSKSRGLVVTTRAFHAKTAEPGNTTT